MKRGKGIEEEQGKSEANQFAERRGWVCKHLCSDRTASAKGGEQGESNVVYACERSVMCCPPHLLPSPPTAEQSCRIKDAISSFHPACVCELGLLRCWDDGGNTS